MDQRQPLYNLFFSNTEHGCKTTRRITDRSIHNSYVYLNGVKTVLQNLLHYNDYRIVKITVYYILQLLILFFLFVGSIIVLIILFVLIVHGKTVSIGKESFGDAGSFGFPYSTVLCFIGCVLIIANAVILTRRTLRYKEPFKYEMMVIDTSKGSGGTYVAKT